MRTRRIPPSVRTNESVVTAELAIAPPPIPRPETYTLLSRFTASTRREMVAGQVMVNEYR